MRTIKETFFVVLININHMKNCPSCGKVIPSETSNFCDNCGTKIPLQSSSDQKNAVDIINEEKNPYLAVVCSFFIPGLGQTYNGQTAKGVVIFFAAVVGFFMLILPALLVWLFGMYDAYTIATKMNNKEIPFLPTSTAHLILFIILVIFITCLVIFIVFIMVVSAVMAPFAASLPKPTPFPILPR